MKKWRLKNLQTNDWVNEPKDLPENWGPIFGMEGVKDRLNDLSWIGITDLGWFEVDVPDEVIDYRQMALERVEFLLRESDRFVAVDSPSTKQERADWLEYRRQLNEVYLQPGFPTEIFWPTKPE